MLQKNRRKLTTTPQEEPKQGLQETIRPVMQVVDALNDIPDYMGIKYNSVKDKLASVAGMGVAAHALSSKRDRRIRFERKMRDLMFKQKVREMYADTVEESTATLRRINEKLERNQVFFKDLQRDTSRFISGLIIFDDL